MYNTTDEIKRAITELENKYPDKNMNNNKTIYRDKHNPLIIPNTTYCGQSMKRYNLENVSYQNCTFENVAFTNSLFHTVSFSNCNMNGNSFACCNYYNSVICNKSSNIYVGNNFSQTNFIGCKIYKSSFSSSSFLQTLFQNCDLQNNIFISSTLEGCCFMESSLNNIDFGNANVEFIELLYTKLKHVIFPFYQFAYIIGVADYIKSIPCDIIFKAGTQLIQANTYLEEVDNLIMYYHSNGEYFPVCNLQIIKNDILSAKKTLLAGINAALLALDFRMIRHLCRLAARHALLDEVTVKRISDSIESHLVEGYIPPERLNECIIHAGEIRKNILLGSNTNITLSFNIKTNICKKNRNGIKYVNSLCKKINESLSENDMGQRGFQVAISNFSPYEIIIDIVCAAGSLATIAQVIWQIIDGHKNKEEYIPIDTQLYHKYIDARIDSCKYELQQLKKSYSDKKMNAYIEEITQKLKTDINDLYDKDIMIFKKKNDPNNN